MANIDDLIDSLSKIKPLPASLLERLSNQGQEELFLDLGFCMLVADTHNQLGNASEALRWYQHTSEKINPSYPSAYANQALCLYRLNQKEKALDILDNSLSLIDFGAEKYSDVEILSYFKVYCLFRLKKENPERRVHACFVILEYRLRDFLEKQASCSDRQLESLLDQCTALCALKSANPNPIPHDSRSRILQSLQDYLDSSTGQLIISRPGNIEMSAILCDRFTYDLGNNAGIYDSLHFRGSNESFIEWRNLYIKAMQSSSCIMICNFFDNYAGPALSEYNLQDKCVNCPSDLEFYCQTLEMLLSNKKVLCISPFAKTMSKQSCYLDNVHDNRYSFNAGNLRFYRCKQSISFSSPESWLNNFNTMQEDLELIDFDIALVSAGGYGHPIIQRIAEQGKSAIYCGGILQAVFGILGRRYDDIYSHLTNRYWVRPSSSEIPEGFMTVENGCYW